MGWLRLVGSLKLQVSFAKEPYKRDDILQKRPMITRSVLIEAPPYPDVYISDVHISDVHISDVYISFDRALRDLKSQ